MFSSSYHFSLVLLLLLLIFIFIPYCFAIRDLMTSVSPISNGHNATWSNFKRFLDVQKGSEVDGISELKKYLHHFGYLPLLDDDNIFNNVFDTHFESALISYQSKLGLPITGNLDSNTISQIMVPRCGVGDGVADGDTRNNILHTTEHFQFFPGQPRWAQATPMTLTYALSPDNTIGYLQESDMKEVFRRAFTRWASVIPVNFTEAQEYRTADIKIGFYKGDHGDGEPFDGVLGVLGHAFSPQSGRFHLDASETWSIDLRHQKSNVAIDLESVVTHEIGHVLGLAHSKVKEAVMFPSLSPRTKKIDLRVDDVKGVQVLYGSNPNFKFSSLLVSDTSKSEVPCIPNKWFIWLSSLLILLFCFRL